MTADKNLVKLEAELSRDFDLDESMSFREAIMTYLITLLITCACIGGTYFARIFIFGGER